MSVRPEHLENLRAVVEKVDGAVATIVARNPEHIACGLGCSACCTAGLSILAVEAAAIEVYAARPDVRARILGAGNDPAACAFLDDAGGCAIYPARPLVCRTHGVPLRERELVSLGTRPVDTRPAENVKVCPLNFVDKTPDPVDILDAATLQVLLSTTDAVYRARSGAAEERVELSELAARLRARSSGR